jgi:hypothetical protein
MAHPSREPKVPDENVIVVIQKNVFWLEVPMANAVSMEIFQAIDNLSEEVHCCLFRQLSKRIKVTEEFAMGSELHKNVQMPGALTYIEQFE